MNFQHLFSPCAVGKRTAPNRFVSQAMEANDGENGVPGERALERYRNLARGKWGVVIVEALSVTETSLARKNGMVIRKKHLDAYKRLVDEFKRIDPDSLLLFQITHSGYRSGSFSDKTAICPEHEPDARYLSADEIEVIRQGFVEGVLTAEAAGADGVDVKSCHGYFGAEMLRPANTRTDGWGGSFEARTRFLRESVEEMQSKIKNRSFVLGSRLSLYEGIRGGCGTIGKDEIVEDLSEMFEVIRLMAKLGMDYVNVSAGIPAATPDITRPTAPSKYLQLHHLRYTKAVKELNLPLAVFGSAYSFPKAESLTLAEEMIAKGYTDFAGWGRQSFADPLFPEKVRRGENVNYCTACSGCTKLMIAQVNDGCIMYDEYYKNLFKTINK